MDLRRVKDDYKLELCRKYYIGEFITNARSKLDYGCPLITLESMDVLFISGGFALLPFLWFVNSVWFFKEAFIRDAFEQQKQIKTCELGCLLRCSPTLFVISWCI